MILNKTILVAAICLIYKCKTVHGREIEELENKHRYLKGPPPHANGPPPSLPNNGPCDIDNGGCAHTCTNLVANDYICSCIDGYELDTDGHTCNAMPVYYNECEARNDFSDPLIGGDLDPHMIINHGTPKYMPSRNNNGVQCVGTYRGGNPSESRPCNANIYPYQRSIHPDFNPKALTLHCWTRATGGWRGKKKNTHVRAISRFYLAEGTFVDIRSIKDPQVVTLYVAGKSRFTYTVPSKYTLHQIFLRYNSEGLEEDKAYNLQIVDSTNGQKYSVWAPSLTAESINSYQQYFQMSVYTSRWGSRSTEGVAAFDSIRIWPTSDVPIEDTVLPECTEDTHCESNDPCMIGKCIDETCTYALVPNESDCIVEWKQIGADIVGDSEQQWLGYSVSNSEDGKVVAAGAPYANGNSGIVRVFRFNEDETSFQIGGDVMFKEDTEQFGNSVAVSPDGQHIAVGAPWYYGDGFLTGRASVFEFDIASSKWIALGEDIIGNDRDLLGHSIALSSTDVVAVGAPYADGGDDSPGYVRISRWNAAEWEQIGRDVVGEAGDRWFGQSVAVSDNGNIVAAGGRTGNNDEDAGFVRVFHLVGEDWEQLGEDIRGAEDGDLAGWSVDLSADGFTLAVGTPQTNVDGKAGLVRVYRWVDEEWKLMGEINGENDGDHAGYSTSVSFDGNLVAIGAYGHFNAGQVGKVSVHGWNEIDSTWNQIGSSIEGKTDPELLGWSTSISPDGTSISIGAIAKDNNAGSLSVYNFNVNEGEDDVEGIF